jgi:hypothetical protein
LQRVGVFLYSVGDEKELIIGSTGTVQNNGTLKIKNGGLKENRRRTPICKTGRKYSWPAQMKIEDISTLK